jgi:hypothetical protein
VCRVRPLCSSTIRQKPVHAEELARDNCRTASNDEQSAPKPSKMLPLGRVIVLLVRVARAQTLKSGLMGRVLILFVLPVRLLALPANHICSTACRSTFFLSASRGRLP